MRGRDIPERGALPNPPNTMSEMKRTLLSTGVALVLGLLGGASLGGCGSSTKTVSATNEPPATETSAATTTAKTTRPQLSYHGHTTGLRRAKTSRLQPMARTSP